MHRRLVVCIGMSYVLFINKYACYYVRHEINPSRKQIELVFGVVSSFSTEYI